eukprot:PhF_6_TR13003/c5_g1_i1/m.20595
MRQQITVMTCAGYPLMVISNVATSAFHGGATISLRRQMDRKSSIVDVVYFILSTMRVRVCFCFFFSFFFLLILPQNKTRKTKKYYFVSFGFRRSVGRFLFCWCVLNIL